MKKLILLFVCIVSGALLASCTIPGLTPTPDTSDTPKVGYADPSHKTGTYKVVFDLEVKRITHFYEAREMPEPPTEGLDYETEQFRWVFTGWDRELAPVGENTTYVARYDQVQKTYTAKFDVGRREIKVVTDAGKKPVPPADVADYEGMSFVCWDREIEISYTDVTYTAVFTDMLSVDQMRAAYKDPLMAFSSDFQNLHSGASYTALALQELTHPLDGAVADRVAGFIASTLSSVSKNTLEFDAHANWGFPGYLATFTIAKATPTVWSRLDYSTRERLNTFMEAALYQTAFNIADYNGYKSGPGMQGNFGKDWNPNYRLGNVPNLAFAVYYFGEGDLQKGAQKAEKMIADFNKVTYDSLVRRFDTYGWDFAFATWTNAAPVDGALSAEQLLVEGGNATVAPQYNANGGGGGGKGVSGQGEKFKYKGYTLYETDKILEHVLDYTFSGGKVLNDWYFDVTGDGTPDRIGYILDGTTTPLLGQDGMMLEFASGNRSSTEYNDKNFVMVMTVLSACYHLPQTENGEAKTDAFGNALRLYDVTKNETLWKKIQVGSEDFLYKFGHGYMCYASGLYYEGTGEKSYEKHASRGHFVVKDLWRRCLLPLGTVEPST